MRDNFTEFFKQNLTEQMENLCCRKLFWRFARAGLSGETRSNQPDCGRLRIKTLRGERGALLDSLMYTPGRTKVGHGAGS